MMGIKSLQRILTVLYFLMSSIFAFGLDADSTLLVIPEVNVIAKRSSQFSTGQKEITIDSTLQRLYQGATLADLLVQQSTIGMNTQGQGMLTTASFRGAASEHTAVLWNGFNLQSTMNGVMDLNLIPLDFMQEVKLLYGGSSALFGSGAIGGALQVNNLPAFDQGVKCSLSIGAGSFGIQKENIAFDWSNAQIATSFQMITQTAQNDFPYYNTYLPSPQWVNQSHASMHQWALMQDNSFKINNAQQINVHAWLQNTYREIPPTMSSTDAMAFQKDISVRISADWSIKIRQNFFTLRGAYFNEGLDYMGVGIPSNSKAETYIIEAEDKFVLKSKSILDVGLNNTFAHAMADGYPLGDVQERTAFFASLKHTLGNNALILCFNLREELVGGNRQPATPSFGLESQPIKHLVLFAHVSKNYRLPTFNELYWSPGGNPNLLPENGFSQDLGMKWSCKINKLSITPSGNLFSTQASNLIVWIPKDAINWYATNLITSASHGFELQLEVAAKIEKVNVKFSAQYNNVFASNQGHQLVYVPIETGLVNLTINFKNTCFNFNQNYIGYRFTLADNSQYLNPYQLGNFSLVQIIHCRKMTISPYLRLNNIWNAQYQAIANYPMPMFNFQLGIKLEFHCPQHLISSSIQS